MSMLEELANTAKAVKAKEAADKRAAELKERDDKIAGDKRQYENGYKNGKIVAKSMPGWCRKAAEQGKFDYIFEFGSHPEDSHHTKGVAQALLEAVPELGVNWEFFKEFEHFEDCDCDGNRRASNRGYYKACLALWWGPTKPTLQVPFQC